MPMNPRLLRPRARQTGAAPPSGTPASLLLRFDGNFNDSSANALTVTAIGDAAISATTKKWGSGSASFDGSSDYLTVPTGGTLGFGAADFTVELWAFVLDGANSNEHVLFSQAAPTDAVGIAISIYQNDLMWLAGGDPTWTFQRYPSGGHFAAGSVNLDEWNHLAVTRHDGVLRLFCNGQVVDTYADAVVLADTNELVSIGGRSNFSQFFSGYIDDVRIVKGLAVYTSNFIPPTAPLAVNATPYVPPPPPPPSAAPSLWKAETLRPLYHWSM